MLEVKVYGSWRYEKKVTRTQRYYKKVTRTQRYHTKKGVVTKTHSYKYTRLKTSTFYQKYGKTHYHEEYKQSNSGKELKQFVRCVYYRMVDLGGVWIEFHAESPEDE